MLTRMDRRNTHRPLYAADISANPPQQPARMREPDELTWRHRLMARLMVHGCADAGMLSFVERLSRTKEGKKTIIKPLPPPAPGEPLAAAEAGRLAGLRKRFATSLAEFPIFERQLKLERHRRDYPEAHVLDEQRLEAGEGS